MAIAANVAFATLDSPEEQENLQSAHSGGDGNQLERLNTVVGVDWICLLRRSGRLNYVTYNGFSPLRGGTTRTRRPNNLESSEYAPGPSSASAAASKIGNISVKLLR